MPDPVELLDQSFRAAMRAAYGALLPADASPALGPSRNPLHGDFQANAAMGLSRSLGKQPREIAAAIKKELDPLLAEIAEPVEIAGPGFINIRLKPSALGAALDGLDTPHLGILPPGAGRRETVIVDLCGVNLAKQMHVGHLRATVIGDALARLWERLGHRVIRQNHFGDWGLPIAMVTAAVKRAVDRGEIDLETLTLERLEQVYRRAQRICEADDRGLAAVHRFGLGPKAEAELEAQVGGAQEETAAAKASLLALQRQDPASISTWKRICDITLEACFDTCRRLRANVTAEATAGESTYADELARVVDDLVHRGIAEESEGALIVRLDDVGIKEPCLIRKSDGGYLYATTDIAGVRRRVQTLGANRVVYAVDARQSLHFKQFFAASDKAGYTQLARVRTEPAPSGSRLHDKAILYHAAFGTVLGEDNRPFKTRSGENVRLADLLDEAVFRAEAAVAEKNPDLPAAERRAIAEAVGMSAIKYADLSSDRIKDYVFSFDRMLAFEGNTGPYLMYALVRIRSIFRKAKEQFGIEESRFDSASGATASAAEALRSEVGRDPRGAPPPFLIAAPEEKAIALELLKYPGVIRAAAEFSEPHRLCTYLYDLAGAFSTFFASCPVLHAPDEPTRLARLRLVRLTGRVLKDGLETLGLVPLERM